MKGFIISASIALTGTTGCATIFESSHQDITISTHGDQSPDETQCLLKNEEGEWRVLANNLNAIHRDGNTMSVDCENKSQTGSTTVEPNFKYHYILLDLLWDPYFFSGYIVDGTSNAYYEYPYYVRVEMRDKQTEPTKQASTDKIPDNDNKHWSIPMATW